MAFLKLYDTFAVTHIVAPPDGGVVRAADSAAGSRSWAVPGSASYTSEVPDTLFETVAGSIWPTAALDTATLLKGTLAHRDGLVLDLEVWDDLNDLVHHFLDSSVEYLKVNRNQ